MINFKYSRILVLLACLQVSAPVYSIWGWDTIKKHYTLENANWFYHASFYPSVLALAAKSCWSTYKMKRDIERAPKASNAVTEFVCTALRKQGVPENDLTRISINATTEEMVYWLSAVWTSDGGCICVPEQRLIEILSMRDELANNLERQLFEVKNAEGQVVKTRNREEQEHEVAYLVGVYETFIAHEYSHIKHNDYVVSQVVNNVFGVILLSYITKKTCDATILPKNWKRYFARNIMYTTLLKFLLPTTLLTVGKTMECRADQDAIRVSNDPSALHAAATCFSRYHQTVVENLDNNKLVPSWWVNNMKTSCTLSELYHYLIGDPHPSHLARARYFALAADKLEKEQKANETNKIS